MKKIVLIIAGALCLTAAAVQAQDPTQQPRKDTIHYIQHSPPSYLKDMVSIQATEIPDSLKSTLQGAQFKGWENGAFYRNQNADEFIIEIRDEVENRTKAFRFDANGKPIKKDS